MVTNVGGILTLWRAILLTWRETNGRRSMGGMSVGSIGGVDSLRSVGQPRPACRPRRPRLLPPDKTGGVEGTETREAATPSGRVWHLTEAETEASACRWSRLVSISCLLRCHTALVSDPDSAAARRIGGKMPTPCSTVGIAPSLLAPTLSYSSHLPLRRLLLRSAVGRHLLTASWRCCQSKQSGMSLNDACL